MISGVYDSQTFGAQVVSKTLDYMNQSQNNFSGKAESSYNTTQNVVGAVVNAPAKAEQLTYDMGLNTNNSLVNAIKGDFVNLVV